MSAASLECLTEELKYPTIGAFEISHYKGHAKNASQHSCAPDPSLISRCVTGVMGYGRDVVRCHRGL